MPLAVLTVALPVPGFSALDGGSVGPADGPASVSTVLGQPQHQTLDQYTVPGTTTTVELFNETDASGRDTACYSVTDETGIGADPLIMRRPDDAIRLKYGSFDPLVFTPYVMPALRASATNDAFIIQFKTPMIDAYRQALTNAGVTLYQFVSSNGFIARIQGGTVQRQAVEALPFVRWVGAYQPAYKLDPELLDALYHDRMYAAESNGAFTANTSTNSAEQNGSVSILGAEGADNGGNNQVQEYSIMVQARGPVMENAVANRITRIGGAVLQKIPQGFRLRATLNPAQLAEILKMNEVLFVDLQGKQENDMDIARQIGGADYLEQTLGISGQGVNAEVMDGGLRMTHTDFINRNLLNHGNANGDPSHGTSTCGIVYGNGTSNPMGTGMLPDAHPIFCEYDLVLNDPNNRYTLTAELVDPDGPYRAVLQSNSWGNSRTTAYTTVSAEMDDILFMDDITVCQSQSNAGNTQSRPQAWAKNIVSVGGVYHFNTLDRSDDRWNRGASTGPASDGRIKPDLWHFYDDIFTTSYTSDTAYTSSFGGTSGATPITAGHFGLLYQMWHEQVFPGFGGQGNDVFDDKCHMTTAKAIMINTAYQYPFDSQGDDLTRVHQGWGMVDLHHTYDQRDNMFIVNESDVLTQGQVQTYYIDVQPGEPEFKATMTFADPMGNPSAQQARINDLTLKVTSPGGQVFWGNNGLLSGDYSTPDGDPNTVDTVENVFVQNPSSGPWTVQVIASEINEDGHVETQAIDVDFALVVSGGLPGQGGGYTLGVTGACPGTITVGWNGATPRVSQGIVFGLSQGSYTIPSGPCAGTMLGLQDNVRLVRIIGTNSGGSGQVDGNVNAGACGHYLQLVEVGSCNTTNVVQIPQ